MPIEFQANKVHSDEPLVTVIALCYNHSRFLIECLDSIASQTFQNFQLIITDDNSSDTSPEMIASWVSTNWPDAIFIRHSKNVGICPTLNEALSCATGKYISMIAADDVWEKDKIEKQLELFKTLPENVAVIYSDTSRIGESGELLKGQFIESHRAGFSPPSGRVFSDLVDGNFIPAMATLIRRDAIDDVGGYDENLTYEDYDMWLRLSEKFNFVYCEGVVAKYRIVSTSIVRTAFINPNPQHSYTVFLIRDKWFNTGLLSPEQNRKWAEEQWDAAYSLYMLGDSRSKACLWKAAVRTKKMRAFALALACSFGVSRARAKKIESYLKRWMQ